MNDNWINDLFHSVKATTDSPSRAIDPRNCECSISHREIWQKAATKAMARKATAPGVDWIAVHEESGKMYIYQVAGYTYTRGLFCDCLNRQGRVETRIR